MSVVRRVVAPNPGPYTGPGTNTWLIDAGSVAVVIDPGPEGDVAAYLRSLTRLVALNPTILFPGHWDPVTEAVAKLEEYRAHRLDRETQVRAALTHGAGTLSELTQRVYGSELGEELTRAAEMTMRAHLQKLADEGAVRVRHTRAEEIFESVS